MAGKYNGWAGKNTLAHVTADGNVLIIVHRIVSNTHYHISSRGPVS